MQFQNTTILDTTDLVLRLYERGARTGQETRVSLLSGQRATVKGSAAREEPFFLEVASAALEANETRDVVVVIDPENTLGRTSPEGTFSGFTYYLFDPADPVCPPERSLRLPEELAPEPTP